MAMRIGSFSRFSDRQQPTNAASQVRYVYAVANFQQLADLEWIAWTGHTAGPGCGLSGLDVSSSPNSQFGHFIASARYQRDFCRADVTMADKL
jgi:hypothetical protein